MDYLFGGLPLRLGRAAPGGALGKSLSTGRPTQPALGLQPLGAGYPKVAPKAAQPSGYWHNPVGIGKIGG